MDIRVSWTGPSGEVVTASPENVRMYQDAVREVQESQELMNDYMRSLGCVAGRYWDGWVKELVGETKVEIYFAYQYFIDKYLGEGDLIGLTRGDFLGGNDAWSGGVHYDQVWIYKVAKAGRDKSFVIPSGYHEKQTVTCKLVKKVSP